MKPKRIQLKRTKGWRMPPNTVKVDRTTKCGNPFKGEGAVDLFARLMRGDWRYLRRRFARKSIFWVMEETRLHASRRRIVLQLPALRGKNLACWCKPGEPCHADVLLELANGGAG